MVDDPLEMFEIKLYIYLFYFFFGGGGMPKTNKVHAHIFLCK